MLKTIVINIFKFSLAASLIAWLVSSGKLDFNLLTQLKGHPFAVVFAVLFSILNYLLISYRWKSILRARSENNIPLLGMLKITWIGQFFSSVLPGSVSGDLVKIIYIRKFEPHLSKQFLFASILIDRVMGLCGLIFLVGISSLLFGSHILENAPAMEPLLKINYVIGAGIVLGIAIFFFGHDFVKGILLKLQGMFLSGLFKRIISLWEDLVSIKSKMIKAIVLSVGVQFMGVVIFWSLISPFVEDKMDFVQALAFLPLGLMTLALPVAPSGLGVGHAIFQKLFEFSNIDNGASLFNLYFIVTLVVNLLGVIPYVLHRNK